MEVCNGLHTSVTSSQLPGSRVPSRLSVQARESASLRDETSTPGTPIRIRGSSCHTVHLRTLTFPAPQPVRLSSAIGVTHSRNSSTTEQKVSPSRPQLGAQEPSNKSVDLPIRGATVSLQPLTRSPKDIQLSSPSSSDPSEDEKSPKPKTYGRRLNPSSARHRPQPGRPHQSSPSEEGDNDDDDEEEDDEDSSPFLPFAAASAASTQHQTQDPSATLRGGFGSPPRSTQPIVARRGTMERVPSTNVRAVVAEAQKQMTSSASSNSSGPGSSAPPARPPPASGSRRPETSSRPSVPLSPRRATELAAAGLSPLRRPGSAREGSDGSPSMGSSFSDLDDASVTQSALEEALMSNMQDGRSAGVASRMSTISQALRSRVFDQGGR